MTTEAKILAGFFALSAAHAIGKFTATRKFIPVINAAHTLADENILLTKELSYICEVLNRSEVAAADMLLVSALPHVEVNK